MSGRRVDLWWLTYAVAVLGALAAAGVVGGLYANGSAKPATPLVLTPGLWLLAAVVLGRRAGFVVGALTAAVVVGALLSNLSALQFVTARWPGWWLPGPGACEGCNLDLLVLWQFPAALVLLGVNAVGWWQRRQDRLAGDPGAD